MQADQCRLDQRSPSPRTLRFSPRPLRASSSRRPATDIAPRPPPDRSRRRVPSFRSSSRQSPERRNAYLASASQPSPPSAHGSVSKPRASTPIPILIFVPTTALTAQRARSWHPCLPSLRLPHTRLPRSLPFVQCHTPPGVELSRVRIRCFCVPARSEPAL